MVNCGEAQAAHEQAGPRHSGNGAENRVLNVILSALEARQGRDFGPEQARSLLTLFDHLRSP